MADRELYWWRLTVDGDGKVTSCRAVERASGGGKHCFYVKAYGEKEAARLLSNEIARRLLAARRAKNKAQGLCRCGREREDESRSFCQACLDRNRVHDQRMAARRRGETVPPLDRRTVLRERKESDKLAAIKSAEPNIRLAVLREVAAAWQNAGSNGAFTRWLNEQIAQARGKGAA